MRDGGLERVAVRPAARAAVENFQTTPKNSRRPRVQQHMTMGSELWAAVQQAATARGMTSQAFIRWALERALGMGPVAQHVDDRSGMRPRRKRSSAKATDKESGNTRA